MDLQKHWWLVALVSALGAVALLFVASFLRTPFAVALLVVGVVVFLIVLYLNPAGRYLKLASCLATSWLSIRKGPYLLVSSWEDDSFGRFMVSQQIGGWFDITLGCVIALLLILDFFSNGPEGALRGLLRQVTISLGSRRQQVTTGSPQQAQVGDIRGDHVKIIINQKQGISAAEMDEIVRASAARSQPIERAPDANAEIDLAAERLKSGESQVALHLLSDLRKRRWDKLSDRERFRLLANLGHTHEKKGDLNEAAREYLEAQTYQKEDEQARALEAVAHFILGNNAEAHRLSVAVLADHPNSSLATAVRVRAEAQSVSLDEIEKTIPITIRSTVEVLNAMGWRAAASGDFGRAEQLAREGLALQPEIPELKEQLGGFIMMKEAQDADNELDKTLNPQRRARLIEAEKLLTEVLAVSQNKKAASIVRYYRAATRQLLEQFDQAETDFRAACEADPNDPEPARLFAIFLKKRERRDDAISTLDSSTQDGKAPRNSLLLASFLGDRNHPGDLEKAVDVVKKSLPNVDSANTDLKADLVGTLVYLFGSLGQHERAVETVNALSEDFLQQPARLAILADIHRRAGDGPAAINLAQEAVRSLNTDSSIQDRIRVAEALTYLEKHEEALSVWRQTQEASGVIGLVWPRNCGSYCLGGRGRTCSMDG